MYLAVNIRASRQKMHIRQGNMGHLPTQDSPRIVQGIALYLRRPNGWEEDNYLNKKSRNRWIIYTGITYGI